MPVGSTDLRIRDGEIFVLVGSEMCAGIYRAIVGLTGIISVENLGGLAPTHQIKESVALHCQLHTAFMLHNLQGFLLRIRPVIWTYCYAHALERFIIGNHRSALGGTVAD